VIFFEFSGSQYLIFYKRAFPDFSRAGMVVVVGFMVVAFVSDNSSKRDTKSINSKLKAMRSLAEKKIHDPQWHRTIISYGLGLKIA
jgi:hypothetical protein